MKKYFKYLVLIALLFIPFIKINAVSSDEVDYRVDKYYVNSKIDIAGSLDVREVIVVTGTYNGYIRDILYANSSLKKFTGSDEDFEGSDIYNANDVVNIKVGKIEYKDYEDINFDTIFKDVTYFEEGKGTSGSKNLYELSKISDGKSIKMFNETQDGTTVFYLEYTIANVAVKHKDIAEFYYNYIGKTWDDPIAEYEIRVFLEGKSEDFRVWGHGPLNASISPIEGNTGAILKGTNLTSNTPVDIRLAYDKNLYPVSLFKNTEVEALPKILKVEEERANEANSQREAQKIFEYIMIAISIIYIIGLITLIVIYFLRHDKEYKTTFNGKYFREFIQDYDVEVIDYLMKKHISNDAFNAAILNMINKKIIKVEEVASEKKNKKDYLLTFKNKNNLNEKEKTITQMLFEKLGENDQIKLSDIEKKSKEKENGENILYTYYNTWKSEVLSEAKEQNFFENTKIKVAYILYAIIGMIVGTLFMAYGSFNTFLIVSSNVMLFASVAALIYFAAASKRTKKGNDHYKKWCAFKNFLNDFGRFNEKELPEIKLWEKYLVYATIFGLAKEVSKTMNEKIKIIAPNDNMNGVDNTLFNYWIISDFTNSFNRTMSNSISSATAQVNSDNMSSGSGFGGGLSSGGGFGGGGGGGRGF